MLELTTCFRGITTGIGSRRKAASGAAAVGAAMANLRYISRASAAVDLAVSGASEPDGTPDRTCYRSLQKTLRNRCAERANSGGSVGRRVAEKMIISLPSDWGRPERVEAMKRIVTHIAPPDSEAMAVAYFHGDTPKNPHIHILAVDGRESYSAARSRRPDAQRVRRRDVIRLGDRGRPKALRGEIASIINEVAQKHGRSGVEWRSFKDRGITRKPKRHIGTAQKARRSRQSSGVPRRSSIRRSRVSQMASDYEMRRIIDLTYSLLDTRNDAEER